MHLVFGSATLNGACPVDQLDAVVADWQGCGQSREETRQAITTEALSRHLDSKVGGSLILAALGLAFTSGFAPMLRDIIAKRGYPLRLTYQIEDYLVNGRRAVNFRLHVGDQRDPFFTMPLAAMPPTATP
jgi:hypothetical protein